MVLSFFVDLSLVYVVLDLLDLLRYSQAILVVTMFLRPYLLSRKFGAIFSKHLCNSAIVPLKNLTIVEIAGEIQKPQVKSDARFQH